MDKALDVRILRSIPTPVADVLLSKGCATAGDVLAKPNVLHEALSELRASDLERRAPAMVNACRREVVIPDAWGASDSALALLRKAQMQPPIQLPCQGLAGLLGSALRPGGHILELCGLPGAGKTQLCLQLCAAAQIPGASALCEAVFIDVEGSFVPNRYAQICRALLTQRGYESAAHVGFSGAASGHASSAVSLSLETALRGMHVCRAYDATELYATLKHLNAFLCAHPSVRILVLDSIAFCFRHEFSDDAPQRARILTDIAATLRRYGAEHNLVVVVTNHMTTRFNRGAEHEEGWLAPALGETWAHQPSSQLRLERAAMHRPTGRATLTKSVEKATGCSCLFSINAEGIRDAVSCPAGQHCGSLGPDRRS